MLIKWLSISHSEEFLSPGECSALPGSLFVAAVAQQRGLTTARWGLSRGAQPSSRLAEPTPKGGAALQFEASAFGILRSHLTLGRIIALLGQGRRLFGQPAWALRAAPVACGPGSQSLWGYCWLWAGSEVLSCGQLPSSPQLLCSAPALLCGQPSSALDPWRPPQPLHSCPAVCSHVHLFCARSSSGLCGSRRLRSPLLTLLPMAPRALLWGLPVTCVGHVAPGGTLHPAAAPTCSTHNSSQQVAAEPHVVSPGSCTPERCALPSRALLALPSAHHLSAPALLPDVQHSREHASHM